MHARTIDPGSPWPPCPGPFNMAAHVLGRARQHPEKTALLTLSPDGSPLRQWSYGDLSRAVLGTGTGLLRAGASPGSRVLLRLGNSDLFPIAYLGAIAAGLVPVPTSAQLTEPEITAMSAQIAPHLILQDPDLAAPQGTQTRTLSAQDLAGFSMLPPAAYHMGDPNRPAYIVFTSGTSGTPRAVEHAHRAVWARGMMLQGWCGLQDTDRLLHAGAFNWTFTLGTGLIDPWTVGATAIVPAQGTDPLDLPDILAEQTATIFAAAPGVYRKMLRSPKMALPGLRHGLSAGEKLPEDTRAAWRNATGTEIYEAFGMSECSTFVSASPARQAAAGTLGRPQPGRRVALLQNGAPHAQSGEIAVHQSDPGLMLGYVGQPDETRARYQGAWFCTGDLGTRTADGDIRYEGRNDDMMNAGGIRVSPLEVEAAFAGVPGLSQVGAATVEVKPGAQVIALFYSAQDAVEPRALMALAQARLAAYKRPRLYVPLLALPVSANGKLQRRALAALYKVPHDQT